MRMNEMISIQALKPPQEIEIGPPAAPAPSMNTGVSTDEAGGAAQPPPETDPAVKGWIEKINQAATGRVGWVIETGNCLVKAKEELGPRRWGHLFGSGRATFGQRRAEMLMEIVRCPVLTVPKNFSNFPGCWTVLHALSKVPVEVLTQAIADGLVSSKMSLRQARELAKAHRVGPAPQRAEKKFNEDQRLEILDRYLEREVALWPPAYRPDLAAALRDIANHIVKNCL
jgi:hypothetical protein